MDKYQIILSATLATFVLMGIAMMSRVKTAVAGNFLSAVALLTGIGITLVFNEIMSAWTVWAAIAVGTLIGSLMVSHVKMIQMPQTVALFNGLGGGASALVGMLSALGVGFSALQTESITIGGYWPFVRFTALLAVAIGTITLVGSLVAAGKLHRVLPQKPIVWPLHSFVALCTLLLTIAFVITAIWAPKQVMPLALIGTGLASALFGLYFSVRVGGADMPITISLLNSLSGVAGAIAGMAISDVLLVAVGGIVGASGLLLTQIMCRAMNRSLWDILIPKKQSIQIVSTPSSETNQLELRVMELEKKITELEAIVKNLEERVRLLDATLNAKEQQALSNFPQLGEASTAPEEGTSPTAASVLSHAKDIIIVPGYGMALAQAQHQVRQLADKLESRGARVRYAIHPVAGRMPGHMNVLLAEADVDYEQLFEMDAINDDFLHCDAVVVIGANDVLNPAARHAEGTPIYGMPVLNVDQAPQVIICNYDLKPGYAGVENPLYTRKQGVFLELGDAKETLQRLISGIG
ncbi:MAG: NAD(P)(+) transhydrogenase (Re/Si-specific) subunit beta [Prevotella sp.]|nr:NAD(P)(+) transhydrogenase (Re/Si-specific) subunit beta [Prevotella sp.]